MNFDDNREIRSACFNEIVGREQVGRAIAPRPLSHHMAKENALEPTGKAAWNVRSSMAVLP